MKKTKAERELSIKLATERAKCKRLALSIVSTFRSRDAADSQAARTCDDIIACIKDEWKLLAPRRTK